MLTVFDGPVVTGVNQPNEVTSVSFPDTIDGQTSSSNLVLFNSGDQDLHISNIRLLKGNTGFSLQSGPTLPVVLPSLDLDNPAPLLSSLGLTLQFNPTGFGVPPTPSRSPAIRSAETPSIFRSAAWVFHPTPASVW